jgi:glycerol-3-phosphate acyltransferase PlsY
MLQLPVTWIVLAYLVGAIPIGLIVGRLRGVDIRGVGSGNIGATNAGRALGRKWGLLVFAGDVLKAWLPVALAGSDAYLGGRPEPEVHLCVVGAAAFLGHIFPIYLRFRGGKGVAVALGVTLAFAPVVAGAAVLLYLVTLKVTRVSALGSLTAVSAMALFVLVGQEHIAFKLLVTWFALMIYWRHRSNIRELWNRPSSDRDDGDASS